MTITITIRLWCFLSCEHWQQKSKQVCARSRSLAREWQQATDWYIYREKIKSTISIERYCMLFALIASGQQEKLDLFSLQQQQQQHHKQILGCCYCCNTASNSVCVVSCFLSLSFSFSFSFRLFVTLVCLVSRVCSFPGDSERWRIE